jgi:hypothetical protein
MDCWGLVEFWYWHVYQTRLAGREGKEPSPSGFAVAYGEHANGPEWRREAVPQNGHVAAMKAVHGRLTLNAGHCGLFWDGRVLQMTESGFVAPKINDVLMRGRVTGWYRHNSR